MINVWSLEVGYLLEFPDGSPFSGSSTLLLSCDTIDDLEKEIQHVLGGESVLDIKEIYDNHFQGYLEVNNFKYILGCHKIKRLEESNLWV